MKKFNWFLLILTLLPFIAIAEENISVESANKFMSMSLTDLLDYQVTTSTKTKQGVQKAPSVMSVVTQEQIQQYGWISLNDVLARQPGFFPSHDFDRRTIGSRGLFEGWNNNHYLLLIDGIPFNDNLYGSAYTWEITPLSMMQAVEIIRGPGSALYGSNATSGVINISTFGSAEDVEDSAFFEYQRGSQSTNIVDARAIVTGSTFNAAVSLNSYQTDGNEYESYDLSSLSGRVGQNGEPLKFETKDSRSSVYLSGKLIGKEAFKGLDFQFHHQSWDFETGHGWLWDIPEDDESMHEYRNIMTLSYVTGKSFKQEYALRYQKHHIDWNMQYYRDGSWENFYPNGSWEYLNTSAEDVWGRAQVSHVFDNSMTILTGVEGTVFLYNGDEGHFSNTQLNNATDGWPPFPNGEFREMGPWFEYIDGKPVYNIAAYSQLVTGDAISKQLELTLGLRFDRQFFDYVDISDANRTEKDKSFSQVSPRLAAVYQINKDTHAKIMVSRAFRAPSPTELFGANTFTLASNIDQLKPEEVFTYEAAFDWNINKNVTWRMNAYHTDLENQIAYSLANNNLSTNIYSLTTAGFETELYVGYENWSMFANYSYAKRLDEDILDNTISESSDTLTWAPAHTFNASFSYQMQNLLGSLQLHYQGEVKRRQSDTATFPNLRPSSVGDWITADLLLSYKAFDGIELVLKGTNIFDETQYIVKGLDYPFDYQGLGRSIFATVRVRL